MSYSGNGGLTLKMIVSYVIGAYFAWFFAYTPASDPKADQKFVVLIVVFANGILLLLSRIDFDPIAKFLGRLSIHGVMAVIALGAIVLVSSIASAVVAFAFNAFDIAPRIPAVIAFVVAFGVLAVMSWSEWPQD